MAHFRKPATAAGLVAGLLGLTVPAAAVEPQKLVGGLIGLVKDSAGVPQMGATVMLYNRYDRLLQQAITNEQGAFGFDSLLPDLYSVRVSLASFVPAMKRNISVQPGMKSFLAINLASMLSSIELVYSAPGQNAIMSEDWKWVLRSSSATRPVLRILPGIDISDPNRVSGSTAAVFSNTRGIFSVSAGDGATFAAGGQPDLGTAFALATSVWGANHLEVSGNVGYGAHSGIPTAGFRTGFSREVGGGMSPEVNLTMRQVFLPVRTGTGLLGSRQAGAPALRTMSVSTMDRREITDDVVLEYGSSLESVSFLDRLYYFSPFARLTYQLGDAGSVQLAYSSGAPAAELLGFGEDSEPDLQEQLSALGLFPRVSLRNGDVQAQRTENFEIGYRHVAGSRTYGVGVYRESVSNAVLTMAAPSGFYSSADLLPDLSSNSSIFNAGRFRRMGYMASVTQSLPEGMNLTLAYGSGGALEAQRPDLRTANPDEVRGLLRSTQRGWVMARLAGTSPVTGTRFAASYQWTDYSALSPMHLYLTQRMSRDPGLNFYVRQPIPAPGVFPGRLEASADLRNLLAQGYLPLTTNDGRQILLIHSPRAVRGGLSFIF